MSLRFRRIIRIAPGVRLNWSLGGPSLSVGPRGASMTIGKRGTYANLGIPGTGISARQHISGSQVRASRDDSSEPGSIKVTARLNDDGSVQLLDEQGNPLPSTIERQLKSQKQDVIRAWLQDEANEFNVHLNEILNIHLVTPPPDRVPVFQAKEFPHKKPSSPELPDIGLFTKALRPGKKRELQKEIDRKKLGYTAALRAWGKLRELHIQKEEKRIQRLNNGLRTKPEVMVDVLQAHLDELQWPRETIISFDLGNGGREAWLDVDLPEVEDMPSEQASVPARGFRLTTKPLSERKSRENYAIHIHAIVFRLVGEVLATLHSAEKVSISGYSQRMDKATANIVDEYLLSVRIHRDQWASINFGRLPDIDVMEALASFDLRRKMTKTGIFSAIEPFSPDD